MPELEKCLCELLFFLVSSYILEIVETILTLKSFKGRIGKTQFISCSFRYNLGSNDLISMKFNNSFSFFGAVSILNRDFKTDIEGKSQFDFSYLWNLTNFIADPDYHDSDRSCSILCFGKQ